MKVAVSNMLPCQQGYINWTANYPETLKAAYIINSSKVFKLVFGIMKVRSVISGGQYWMNDNYLEYGQTENSRQDQCFGNLGMEESNIINRKILYYSV